MTTHPDRKAKEDLRIDGQLWFVRLASKCVPDGTGGQEMGLVLKFGEILQESMEVLLSSLLSMMIYHDDTPP